MLEIDLKNAIAGTADNFTCKLMQLIMKADQRNLQRLREAYPEEVEYVLNWRNGWTNFKDCKDIKITPAAGINFRV